MDVFLQEITILPKVLGCFVYSGNLEIAGSKLPPVFQKQAAVTIGNLLSRTMQLATLASLDLSSLEISYRDSLLLIRPLDDGATLILICEPGVNKSLINMTIDMLADELNQSLTAVPPPKRTSIVEELAASDSTLQPILAGCSSALTEAIGPIASVILEDCLNDWKETEPATVERIPELVQLLSREIDDKQRRRDFVKTVGKHLSPA